jgi:hypothetical protein
LHKQEFKAHAHTIIGFFPFGVENGDEVGPMESDASTSEIHLDDPVVFYLRNQTNLYVS